MVARAAASVGQLLLILAGLGTIARIQLVHWAMAMLTDEEAGALREAEARHIRALLRLFERYHLAVPDNEWPGHVDRYEDLLQACEAGVTAEIDNGEMYDRLMKAAMRDDILAVFANLREASQERHLPAFRRCVHRHGRIPA